MAEVKNKEFQKQQERETVTYKGGFIRLLADFSTDIFQDRRYCLEVFKMMKKMVLQ